MSYNRDKIGGKECINLLEYIPCNIGIYDNSNNIIIQEYTINHFNSLIEMLKRIERNNNGLIYVIYVVSKSNKPCLKIGRSKTVKNFIDKGGRMDDHTKNYEAHTIILLRVFEITNNLDEIEKKLHLEIKNDLLNFKCDPLASLVKRTPLGNLIHCTESYPFIKDLYLQLEDRINRISNSINDQMLVDL